MKGWKNGIRTDLEQLLKDLIVAGSSSEVKTTDLAVVLDLHVSPLRNEVIDQTLLFYTNIQYEAAFGNQS